MVLYNVPGRTVADMQHDTVLRLAQVPGIVGIKEATGNIERAAWLIKQAPQGLLDLLGRRRHRGGADAARRPRQRQRHRQRGAARDARAVHGGASPAERASAPRDPPAAAAAAPAACSSSPARRPPSGRWRAWACAAPPCACRSCRSAERGQAAVGAGAARRPACSELPTPRAARADLAPHLPAAPRGRRSRMHSVRSAPDLASGSLRRLCWRAGRRCARRLLVDRQLSRGDKVDYRSARRPRPRRSRCRPT